MKLYKVELFKTSEPVTKFVYVNAKDLDEAEQKLKEKFNFDYYSANTIESYIDNIKSDKTNDDIPDKKTIDKVLNHFYRMNGNGY